MLIDGARVLMTGCTGFVGCSLIAQAPNVDMVVKTRNADAFTAKAPELAAKVEFTDTIEGRWDYIIHGGLEPVEAVLEVAERCRSPLLYLSSGAVYYRADEYAERKRADEFAILSSKLKVCCARMYCFIGPYLPVDRFVIGKFIATALAGKPLVVDGGRQLRSYMDASDMGQWLWAILERGKRAEYDVGSDEVVSLQQAALTVAECVGETTRVIIDRPNPELPYPERYLPLLDEFNQDIGEARRYNLRDGVLRMMEWLRGR